MECVRGAVWGGGEKKSPGRGQPYSNLLTTPGLFRNVFYMHHCFNREIFTWRTSSIDLDIFSNPTLNRRVSIQNSKSYREGGGIFPSSWLWVLLCMCCWFSLASPASSAASRGLSHLAASGTLSRQGLLPPNEFVGCTLNGVSSTWVFLLLD